MRIADLLLEKQVAFETLVHPPAFTAHNRAKFLGMPGARVAKSILLVGPKGYFLAVLPATHQVDTEELARCLGGPVRLANADELAQVFLDCEWGVVAPFGTLYGLPTFLDESLPPETTIVLEVQNHAMAIRMRCSDFEQVEKPRRLRLARP